MNRLERIVAVSALLLGAFEIYVYLFPDSSKLPSLAYWTWAVVAFLLAVAAVVFASDILKND